MQWVRLDRYVIESPDNSLRQVIIACKHASCSAGLLLRKGDTVSFTCHENYKVRVKEMLMLVPQTYSL